MNFYFKECLRFRRMPFILSFLLIPAMILKSLVAIYIPKMVIDSIELFSSEKAFVFNILVVTCIMAFASVGELLVKNLMEHTMNSFVLIKLNRLWVEKVSTMDYEVFTSEVGKQSTSKARIALEGTTRWGIGTYIPRLLELVTSLIGFFIYAAILMYVHPIVLVALVLTYSINLIVTLKAEQKKQLLKNEVAKANRKMNYFAYNTRGMDIAKDIRIYSMREWISRMSTQARLDKRKVDEKVQGYQVSVEIINAAVVFIRDGIVYSILIWLAIRGKITIGNFALYTAAVSGLGEWLSQITRGIGALSEANNDINDFREFLSLPDGKSDSKKTFMVSSAPIIEMKNVSFSYDNEKMVLDDISLTVNPGEKIAIVGSNGAGKTTFIKLICGLLHPTKGDVSIDGVQLSMINQEDCANNISAVFQDSSLMPVSIKDNIVMNDKKVDEEKLKKVVSLVGLDEKIASLERGVETPLVKHITENGTEFSGGEVQKLLLSRAIYKDSPILVLDEPTAAMDPIAEQNIYLKYNELSKNKTAFFISHRLSSTRFCDRIILIDDGKIKEMGTHDELMKKGGMYFDMYNIQSKYYKNEEEKAV